MSKNNKQHNWEIVEEVDEVVVMEEDEDHHGSAIIYHKQTTEHTSNHDMVIQNLKSALARQKEEFIKTYEQLAKHKTLNQEQAAELDSSTEEELQALQKTLKRQREEFISTCEQLTRLKTLHSQSDQQMVELKSSPSSEELKALKSAVNEEDELNSTYEQLTKLQAHNEKLVDEPTSDHKELKALKNELSRREEEFNSTYEQLAKLQANNEKQIADLTASHKEELNALKQALSRKEQEFNSTYEQLSQLKADNEKQIAELKSDHKKELKALKKALGRKEEEFNSTYEQLTKIKANNEKQYAELTSGQKEELKALRNALSQKEEEFNSTYQELTKLKADTEKQVTELKSCHTEELKALKDALDRKKEEFDSTYEQLSKLKADNEKQVAAITSRQKEELVALQASAVNQEEKHKTTFEQLTKLKSDFEKQIFDLTSNHNEELKVLKAAAVIQEEKLKTMGEQLVKLKTDNEKQVAELTSDHKEQLQPLNNTLKRQEEEFNSTYEHLTRLRADNEKQVAELKTSHKEELKALKSTAVNQEEKLRASYEQLTKLKSEYENQIAELISSHKEEIRSVKAATVNQEETLKTTYEQLLKLKANYEKQVADLTSDHKEELQALKNALSRQEDKYKSTIVIKDKQIGDLFGRLEESRLQRRSLMLQMENVVAKSTKENTAELLLKTTEAQLSLTQDALKQETEKVSGLEKTIQESNKLIAELKIDGRISARKIKELEQDKANENQKELILAEKDRKIKQLQTNINLLKGSCSLLEGQLQEFEDAVAIANKKVETISAEKVELSNLLAKTKETLTTTNIQLNELKSLRIFNEKQIGQLKSRISSDEVDAQSQKAKLNEQLANSIHVIKKYEMELNDANHKCDQLEIELNSWKTQVDHLHGQVTTGRTESSTFLMQIVKLKEANMQLQSGFEESITKGEQLKAVVNELNSKLSALTAEKLDTELKYESTVQQQAKLIEHLQKQLEQLQSKKSRGFVERIFGHSGHQTPNENIGSPLTGKTHNTPMKSRTLGTPVKKIEQPLSAIPTRVLSEIQNVTKIADTIEEDRKREECILLKRKEEEENQSNSSLIQKTLLYREDKQLDINCCVSVLEDVYLIGCVDGLYSVNQKSGLKAKIDGVATVWAISLIIDQDFAVVIEGPDRNLARIHLGLLRSCAEAAECSKPKVTSTPILHISNAYMFKMKFPYLAVAGEKYLRIVQLEQNEFHLKFKIQTPTNVTSMLFTSQQTLLFGTDLVYELDLLNGQVEEFMDSTDNTLQINIANCTQFKQYPLAILDLTRTTAIRKNNILRREYLVAFPDFGIFLDENGRRARDMDIVWSKLPSCIEYRQPNLYIEHFTSVEVLQLNNNSFTRSSEPSLFLSLKSPKLIGCFDSSGSAVVVTTSKNLTEIFTLHYPCNTIQTSIDSTDVDTSSSSADGKRVLKSIEGDTSTTTDNTTTSSY